MPLLKRYFKWTRISLPMYVTPLFLRGREDTKVDHTRFPAWDLQPLVLQERNLSTFTVPWSTRNPGKPPMQKADTTLSSVCLLLISVADCLVFSGNQGKRQTGRVTGWKLCHRLLSISVDIIEQQFPTWGWGIPEGPLSYSKRSTNPCLPLPSPPQPFFTLAQVHKWKDIRCFK